MLTELTDMELDRVTGGQGIPSGATPPPTGNLGSDVVRFFTDAAHGAARSHCAVPTAARRGANGPSAGSVALLAWPRVARWLGER